MKGNISNKTGLWHLPVNPSEPPDDENITEVTSKKSNSSVKYGAANSVYTLPYKQQQVKYMHQVFCSPPIATLEKAIANNQLTGFPCMKNKLVRKYLAPSPATPIKERRDCAPV